jgi:TM2 domain-containing membrane protein YozV
VFPANTTCLEASCMGAWYYVEAGRVMGPLSETEVRGAVGDGLLAPETPVWTEGMNNWLALACTTEFFEGFPPDQRRYGRENMEKDLPTIPIPPKPVDPIAPATPQGPLVQMNFTPPYQPPPVAMPIVYGPPKSRVAAGVLGILLGSLGIHRFYLGYTGIGMLMLLITVCTCGYGSIITGIWGLIEGILCLTGSMMDAQGRPLSD